jgi:hypothetical protein
MTGSSCTYLKDSLAAGVGDGWDGVEEGGQVKGAVCEGSL